MSVSNHQEGESRGPAGLRRKRLIRVHELFHNRRSCLKERLGRRRWVSSLSLWHRECLSEYQMFSRSPKPPPLACPWRFEWLVVKLDGDYWSAWRTPAVSAQDWRPHQREFLAHTGLSLRWAEEPRRPGHACRGLYFGLSELGARWSRHFSVYLNNQAPM